MQSNITSTIWPLRFLLRSMLFSDEARLEAPMRGTSTFASEFAATGPRDSAGRSLKDLDLNHRLFRYPCSFLIYSDAFNALPNRRSTVSTAGYGTSWLERIQKAPSRLSRASTGRRS
jgi:hypothetical protein